MKTIFAIALCGLALAIGQSPRLQEAALASAQSSDAAAQKQTMADIRNVGTALLSWLTDEVGAAAAGQSQVPPVDIGDYPEISREDLEKILVPMYLKEVPELDGWGSPYEHYLNTDNPLAQQVMALRSPGLDGYFEGNFYVLGRFDPESFDEDIVWADGFFVRWPQKP